MRRAGRHENLDRATRRSCAWVFVALAGSITSASLHLCASAFGFQEHRSESSSTQRKTSTGTPDGTHFAGFRLTQAPVAGPISLSARKAETWKTGNTQRLLLVGDVRITLGSTHLSAGRAVVCIEKLMPPRGTAEAQAYQVFLYLDRAGSPNDAAGMISLSADRLPVWGVLVPAAEEGVRLRCDDVEPRVPNAKGPNAGFLSDAEERFATMLRRLEPGDSSRESTAIGMSAAAVVAERPDTSTSGDASDGTNSERPLIPGVSRPFASISKGDEAPSHTSREVAGPENQARDPIFAATGIFTFSAGDITLVPPDPAATQPAAALLATGGVVVSYSDVKSGRELQVQAQRGVIFLAPGKDGAAVNISRFGRDDVKGVYLEGDVIASDGKYTLRGPRIYYDVEGNRANAVDAVFWTYDELKQLPLYARAKMIRQESAEDFAAKNARLANSAFFEPELSIGASTVTISRRKVALSDAERAAGEPERTETLLDARNITLRAFDVPFFYWPIYAGDPSQLPIRDIRFENSSGAGTAIKVRWNAYSLLGLNKPGDLGVDLLTDYYFDRGLGLGTRVSWDRADSKGKVDAYMVPEDKGTDLLKTGAKIDRDSSFRGILTVEERYRLDDRWTIFLEGSHISDESVVDAFFEQLGEERREFANRVYARRLEESTALTVETKATFNDFVANEYLLQSRGYTVRKTPEAQYLRLADDLLPGSRPGLLTYSSEYRVGIVGIDFDEPLARERGFTSNALAQRAFGIDANDSIASRLRQRGFIETGVARADTRHEVSMQFHEEIVNIQPFAIGRMTMYDNDFVAYSPGERDNARLWGGGGVRVSTMIEHIDDQAESNLLDIHRLRHLVEPSVTLFHAGTTVDRVDLPLYDEGVENLTEGSMARFGLSQTWQTQRGGPGRWHNVDVFKLNTDIVLSSRDTDRKSPIGRFFDYRPEYSNPGNYLLAEAAWQLSDTFALTGSEVFDFDGNQSSASTAGVLIRHAPNFQSFVDAHYVNSQDQTIVTFGSRYELTSRYDVGWVASYDAGRGGFQGVNFDFTRKFENAALGVNIGHNKITGETSIGFLFRPFGASGEARVSGVGSSGGTTAFGG